MVNNIKVLKDNSKKIMINQINNYYNAKDYNIPQSKYSRCSKLDVGIIIKT